MCEDINSPQTQFRQITQRIHLSYAAKPTERRTVTERERQTDRRRVGVGVGVAVRGWGVGGRYTKGTKSPPRLKISSQSIPSIISLVIIISSIFRPLFLCRCCSPVQSYTVNRPRARKLNNKLSSATVALVYRPSSSSHFPVHNSLSTKADRKSPQKIKLPLCVFSDFL